MSVRALARKQAVASNKTTSGSTPESGFVPPIGERIVLSVLIARKDSAALCARREHRA